MARKMRRCGTCDEELHHFQQYNLKVTTCWSCQLKARDLLAWTITEADGADQHPILQADDPFCYADGETVAAWLRSPGGFEALWNEPIIRSRFEAAFIMAARVSEGGE